MSMNLGKIMLHIQIIIGMVSTFFLASCKPTIPLVESSPTSSPTLKLTTEPSPSSSPPPPLPTEDTSSRPKPLIRGHAGSLYERVVSIPIGENGIRYRGAGIPEIEITGPNGLAVLPDGSLIIGDTFDNRLLRYDRNGNRLAVIDLSSLGIFNVSDVLATNDELYLLEINFQVTPEHYRVNRLSFDGRVIASSDIPDGYHLEDGLIGLATGEGQILLELGGGMVRYYQMPGPSVEFGGEFYGLPAYDRLYQTHYESPCGGNPSITVDSRRFETGTTLGGGLGILAVNPDGSFYAWRTDVVDDMPAIVSDQTIHYIDASGEQLGVARYPLDEWYFHLIKYLAIGPDGNAYALITRQNSVDILMLNFYRQLEPIQPDAAQPSIISGIFPPLTDSGCNCSLVQHLSPDSSEAQQITQEFLANFQQDWPTEYMALDPLWGVDQLGEFAIIQGGITQESRGLIAVQQTSRGFVRIADYVVDRPGPRHSIIPDYFRAKLPEAPPELIYCLDLSRFIGEKE